MNFVFTSRGQQRLSMASFMMVKIRSEGCYRIRHACPERDRKVKEWKLKTNQLNPNGLIDQ